MHSSTSFDYRSIIDSFKAKRLSNEEIEQRLSELMLLFDFSSSLTRVSKTEEIADLLLLTVMGYTASRRAAFLLQTQKGLKLVASKGYRSKLSSREWHYFIPPPYPDYFLCDEDAEDPWKEICTALGLQLLVPLQQDGRLLAIVGFGERSKARADSRHDIEIVVSLVQMCAGILENSQTHQTLEFLNRRLTLKIYQLNTLFELSKDFSAVWDSEAIFRILGTSLIGQLLISRCAVFTFLNDTLQLQFVRGLRLQAADLDCLRELNLKSLFSANPMPLYCADISNPELLEFCAPNKIHILFPLVMSDEVRGVILLGDRKNRKPFGQEEYDFINTLGNLALVADENARMQHAMIEKERMEKELAIARDIQVSLLPSEAPLIEGYEIASVFHPCYSVAGDYFDFLPVSDHETAIAIGDVSGKSTPAALIMARLQASLRTLASIECTDPHITLQKLNRLLCERQQSNKYVTFFYGVLNHRDHTLNYVNAGHCYPLIVKRSGRVDRLETGGMVLGFFKDIQYAKGTYGLDPQDLVFFYTDGVSELVDQNEEEFGPHRIIELLQKYHAETVDVIKDRIIAALKEHSQGQHQGDDITFILLKRL